MDVMRLSNKPSQNNVAALDSDRGQGIDRGLLRRFCLRRQWTGVYIIDTGAESLSSVPD